MDYYETFTENKAFWEGGGILPNRESVKMYEMGRLDGCASDDSGGAFSLQHRLVGDDAMLVHGWFG